MADHHRERVSGVGRESIRKDLIVTEAAAIAVSKIVAFDGSATRKHARSWVLEADAAAAEIWSPSRQRIGEDSVSEEIGLKARIIDGQSGSVH